MNLAGMITNKRLCVGILFNSYMRTDRYGSTPESELAVEKTAQEVLHAVTQLGHSAFLLPLGNHWNRLFDWLDRFKLDVIINLCEGYLGCPQFESHVAAILELEDCAFTGNTAKALSLCQDKNKTKIILGARGHRTPKFSLVKSINEEIDLAFPVIVKPNFEDASLGIGMDSVTSNEEELRLKIAHLFRIYGKPVLVEEYIEGREFNVSVYDSEQPIALQVSEIDFSGFPDNIPRICSYEAKWIDEHPHYEHSIPICPAPMKESLRDTLQQSAIEVFVEMECRDYARVDYRVSTEGIPYVLEINPNPDISLNAGYVRALIASGINYKEFWDLMIQKALRRMKNNDPIHAEIRQKVAHPNTSLNPDVYTRRN